MVFFGLIDRKSDEMAFVLSLQSTGCLTLKCPFLNGSEGCKDQKCC